MKDLRNIWGLIGKASKYTFFFFFYNLYSELLVFHINLMSWHFCCQRALFNSEQGLLVETVQNMFPATESEEKNKFPKKYQKHLYNLVYTWIWHGLFRYCFFFFCKSKNKNKSDQLIGMLINILTCRELKG